MKYSKNNIKKNMGVEKKTTINNGKRIDRFNSKKNRKDALKSDDLIKTLAENGLLQIDFDGELKVAPSTNPGWLSIGKKDEGNNGGGPIMVFSHQLSLDGILLTAYTTGPLVNGISIYENYNLTTSLKTGEYSYFPSNGTPASQPQSLVSVTDGLVTSIVILGGPPKA